MRKSKKKHQLNLKMMLACGAVLAGMVIALFAGQTLFFGLPKAYSYVPGNTSFVMAVNDMTLFSELFPEENQWVSGYPGELNRIIDFEYNGGMFSLMEFRSGYSGFLEGCNKTQEGVYDCSSVLGGWYVYPLDSNTVITSDYENDLKDIIKLYPLNDSFNPPYKQVVGMPFSLYMNFSRASQILGVPMEENITRFIMGASERWVKILTECKDIETAEYYEKHHEELGVSGETVPVGAELKDVHREGRWVIITYVRGSNV